MHADHEEGACGRASAGVREEGELVPPQAADKGGLRTWPRDHSSEQHEVGPAAPPGERVGARRYCGRSAAPSSSRSASASASWLPATCSHGTPRVLVTAFIAGYSERSSLTRRERQTHVGRPPAVGLLQALDDVRDGSSRRRPWISAADRRTPAPRARCRDACCGEAERRAGLAGVAHAAERNATEAACGACCRTRAGHRRDPAFA